MRYLAIGDIHGHADVLQQLLEFVQPQPDDQIITLGDYVDRGPDSRGVLDQLIALHATGRLVALRGNHDVMMLEARKNEENLRGWLYCGGKETLISYGDTFGQGFLGEIPDSHWQFLEEDCVDWYEIDTHFFVHAQVLPGLPLNKQPRHWMLWEPLEHARAHCSGKIMICGHTKQRSGLPRDWGCAVCIDTWVYGDGWLTCLDVKSGKWWQANRKGEQREGHLD
jgi:serine/threonine protein phosphatase 1